METIENLEALLASNEEIKPLPVIELGAGEFNRVREFIVKEQLYKIEWWVNLSYLTHGALMVPFHTVKISGTWPNHFKTNLQFYYYNNACAILPLEPLFKPNAVIKGGE